MVANDARCGELPTVTGAVVAKELEVRLRETTVGPFADDLLRDDGIAEVWTDLLGAARLRAAGAAR
jgi:hypothetical protein